MSYIKNNYYSLLNMRILKKTISIFTDSFLVLYFMQLSDNNILPLGIYNLFLYTMIIVTMMAIKNMIKSEKRIYLLRLGMLFNLLFFIVLLFLKDNAIKYAWLLGLIYGIEEGFYFSVFNIYESKIPKDKFPKYAGTYTALNSIVSIIIPIIFGSVMSFNGFENCTIIVLILVIVKLILSFIYTDVGIPKGDKTKIKKYFNIVKNNKSLLVSHLASFSNGLTYSGAFSSLITIYIIKIFKTGFQLGILTSVFAVVTTLASLIFAHIIKRKSYKYIIVICNSLTILSLIYMMIDCGPISIILFNFIQSFAKTYATLINESNSIIMSNCKIIKNNYKEEYFLTHEIFIYFGRLISYIVFCFLAFINTNIGVNIVMIAFIIFIIYRTIISIKLQKISEEN